MVDSNFAYDHKREQPYWGTAFLAVDAGIRSPNDVTGSFSPQERFRLWEAAHNRGLVPEETPLPSDTLPWFAIEHDIVDRDELETWDDDGDTSASDEGTKLPGSAFYETLEMIEVETSITPPRLTAYRQSDTDTTTRDALR